MTPQRLTAFLLLGIIAFAALEHLRPPKWVWLLVLAGVVLVALHLSCSSCQQKWLSMKHKVGMTLLNE